MPIINSKYSNYLCNQITLNDHVIVVVGESPGEAPKVLGAYPTISGIFGDVLGAVRTVLEMLRVGGGVEAHVTNGK